MAKFRIIEKTENGKTFYILQRKFLFWWNTEKDGGYDMLGSYEYDKRFDTAEIAKKYALQCHDSKQKVIEQFEI